MKINDVKQWQIIRSYILIKNNNRNREKIKIKKLKIKKSIAKHKVMLLLSIIISKKLCN
jgi:hypothetical protein